MLIQRRWCKWLHTDSGTLRVIPAITEPLLLKDKGSPAELGGGRGGTAYV